MKKNLLIILITFIITFLPIFISTLSAQPPLPDPDPIPIDGGLTLLIVAGASYGAAKIYKEGKNEKI